MRTMLSGLAMALVLAGCGSTSASGDLIAFVGLLDGDAEIFVMNADGTEVRRLTDIDAPLLKESLERDQWRH